MQTTLLRGRIINSHNKTILNEHIYENERQCNCINKEKCPLDNKCLSSNIVYKATITCDKPNCDAKIYLGISEGKFKTRYANHKKSFCHDKYRTEIELSIEY